MSSFTFLAPVKDPDAVLDYAMDWSSWLADGETITGHTVTVDGVTLDSNSRSDAVITAWLSGGTALTAATLAVRITTTAGRTDERSVRIAIRDR